MNSSGTGVNGSTVEAPQSIMMVLFVSLVIQHFSCKIAENGMNMVML